MLRACTLAEPLNGLDPTNHSCPSNANFLKPPCSNNPTAKLRSGLFTMISF